MTFTTSIDQDEDSLKADEVLQAPAREYEEEEYEGQPANVYFEGDQGRLDIDQRRVLVKLLKERFITGADNPSEWKVLLRSIPELTSRLNDMFLVLNIDRHREVAYKQQARSGAVGRDFSTLLHNTPWNRDETALLVYLRSRLRTTESQAEGQARVSYEELVEHLNDHRPENATNQSADSRRTDSAIQSMKRNDLLIEKESGVFLVSGAVETMLPADKLAMLLAWLEKEKARNTASTRIEEVEDVK